MSAGRFLPRRCTGTRLLCRSGLALPRGTLSLSRSTLPRLLAVDILLGLPCRLAIPLRLSAGVRSIPAALRLPVTVLGVPLLPVTVLGVPLLSVAVLGVSLLAVAVLGVSLLAVAILGVPLLPVAILGVSLLAVAVLGVSLLAVAILGVPLLAVAILGVSLLAVAILGLTANLLGVQLLGVILVGRTAGFSGTEEHGFFAVGIVLMFMIAFHNNQLLAAVSPSPSGNGGNSCPLPSAGFLLAKNLRANDTAGEAPLKGHPKGVPCAELAPQVTEGYFCEASHNKQKIPQKNPSTVCDGSPRTERSPLPCGHLPTPWGVTPFRGGFNQAPLIS